MDANNKYKVPALEKAIMVINTLSQQEQPVGVSELCKMLDIPKTSVFFILNTLTEHEYLLKTSDDKYQIGNKFITIGLTVLNQLNIRPIAIPLMDRLLKQTGFAVHLAILDNGEAMYVEKLESDAFVKFSTHVGQRQPLHVTGVGKAIAAYLEENVLDQIIERKGLEPKTKHTITSKQELKKVLAKVREVGYSLEDEEGEHGVRCIGAPIFNHSGKIAAAISITALRSDLTVHDIPAIGEQVHEAALEISRQIGYIPEKSPSGHI